MAVFIQSLRHIEQSRPWLYVSVADFFLPLLSPETQKAYLNGCTSGSRQLILGFRIPPIIHEAFAEHYGFTEDSCLTYTTNDSFDKALHQALLMTDDEFASKRQSLANIADGVYQESLSNLKRILSGGDSHSHGKV